MSPTAQPTETGLSDLEKAVRDEHNFGNRLRLLRQAAGLSQKVLARAAKLTQQTISQLERGGSQPSWGTVCRLAGALQITPTGFLNPGDDGE